MILISWATYTRDRHTSADLLFLWFKNVAFPTPSFLTCPQGDGSFHCALLDHPHPPAASSQSGLQGAQGNLSALNWPAATPLSTNKQEAKCISKSVPGSMNILLPPPPLSCSASKPHFPASGFLSMLLGPRAPRPQDSRARKSLRDHKSSPPPCIDSKVHFHPPWPALRWRRRKGAWVGRGSASASRAGLTCCPAGCLCSLCRR